MFSIFKITNKNVQMYIVVQIIISFIITVVERIYINNYASQTCIADGIRFVQNGPLFFIILVIYCVYIGGLILDFNDIQKIIRTESRIKICLSQIKKLFVLNMITSLIWVSVGFLNGCISSSRLINWSDENSFYRMSTNPYVTSDITFSTVVAVSICIVMLILNIMSLLLLFSYWQMNSVVMGLVIVIAVELYDNWGKHSKIQLIGQFMVYTNEWANRQEIAVNILCLTVFVIGLSVIELMLAEGKEFIGVLQEKS